MDGKTEEEEIRERRRNYYTSPLLLLHTLPPPAPLPFPPVEVLRPSFRLASEAEDVESDEPLSDVETWAAALSDQNTWPADTIVGSPPWSEIDPDSDIDEALRFLPLPHSSSSPSLKDKREGAKRSGRRGAPFEPQAAGTWPRHVIALEESPEGQKVGEGNTRMREKGRESNWNV